MSVFLFEFITCGGVASEEIAVEGLGMFKSLLKGFSQFTEVNSFVDEKFRELFPELQADKLSDVEDIKRKVEELADESECFVIIAPEDDDLLLELTEIAERRAVNLGSRAEGIKIASNKWETYKRLKNKVNLPLTSKKPLEPPFLIKREKSCGGEGIRVVNEEVDSIETGYIAQEIVQGKALSVSLIAGDSIEVLSINEQIINNFAYSGAVIPAKIDEEEVTESAIKAVECIRGLHGYVGVDVVLAEEPYIIEINARLTTPSIAFEKVYGINLSKLIYDNTFGVSRLSNMRRGINSRTGKRFILKKTTGIAKRSEGFEEIVRFGDRALICGEIQTY